MLAARASAVRNAPRIARTARSFATVVESAGVKVAAADNGEPTTAVTFLVKAGSRYEPKPGVAHALKNYAFKGTEKRSALGTVREAELLGGVLSSTLSREYLALTAEFLRGDEAFFVDVLASFLTSAKFSRYELTEWVGPVSAAESAAALSDPATHALELAHALAFRTGLGKPLFAASGGHQHHQHHLTASDVQAYAHSVFSTGNVAVLGTGITHETLQQLLAASLGTLSSPASSTASPSAAAAASAYFGGETRHAAHGGGPQTAFIGFGTASAPSPALAVLAAHLDPTPAVKWSTGASPLAAAIPARASVRPVLLPYSDAALFGMLVQGETAEDVRVAGKAAVDALKAAGAVAGEDLRRAVAKARFAAASGMDARAGVVHALGPKILSGASASVADAVASFEKVDAAAYAKAASALLKSRLTYVAVGDIHALPYADELGL